MGKCFSRPNNPTQKASNENVFFSQTKEVTQPHKTSRVTGYKKVPRLSNPYKNPLFSSRMKSA